MSEFSGKYITVMGLARSGQAVAEVLHEEGARVFCSDNGNQPELQSTRDRLEHLGIACEIGRHSDAVHSGKDLIVLSPGIPSTIPILRAAAQKGVPIVSEVEIAYRLTQATVIGITGTNGKSTTTSLLGALLNADGKKAAVAGNIGIAVSSVARALGKNDFLVIELSSFQLETIARFRPHIALLLNITPDHLDRYAAVDKYAAAKYRIFMNQTKTDYAVINGEDTYLREHMDNIPAQIVKFGINTQNETDPSSAAKAKPIIQNGQILMKTANGLEKICSLAEIPLQGPHNWQNIMAALTAATLLGVTAAAMRQGLMAFQGLEHRLEFVREREGVRFYNDSKATTVESTIAALNSFARILLIAGGKDKGFDFKPLYSSINTHVKHLTLIGQAGKRMAAELTQAAPITFADSLAAAITEQVQRAVPGDVVLLSPACSSYDMFQDYVDRGRQFKNFVNQL